MAEEIEWHGSWYKTSTAEMIRTVTRKVEGGFEYGIATSRLVTEDKIEDFYTWSGKKYPDRDDAIKLGNAELAGRVPVDKQGFVVEPVGWAPKGSPAYRTAEQVARSRRRWFRR